MLGMTAQRIAAYIKKNVRMEFVPHDQGIELVLYWDKYETIRQVMPRALLQKVLGK